MKMMSSVDCSRLWQRHSNLVGSRAVAADDKIRNNDMYGNHI